jgi:hypothetical protein
VKLDALVVETGLAAKVGVAQALPIEPLLVNVVQDVYAFWGVQK